MTAGAPATAQAAPTNPAAQPRPPRRATGDLSFRLDEALVERFAATEPDWLAADRRAALARFRDLPTESNRLYTPYVDLRAADLEAVLAYDATASEPAAGSARAELATDIAGLIDLREDAVIGIGLDPAAAAAGVTLETIGAFVGRDPATARGLIGDETSLALDDRLAQLTRAGWNQGIVVRVPAGVRLDRPIVLRWSAGAPGRALLTRTIVDIGDGAAASIVEELVSSGPEIACAEGETVPQALYTGTLEVRLGRGADLAVASVQDFGPRQIAFQHRQAAIGDGASLRWALAQLGARLVRSRIDNRLEGDRSSVDQVEIVFGGEE